MAAPIAVPIQHLAALGAASESVVQTALVAVIVLLCAVLVGLAAMVVVLRRRAREAPPAPAPAATAPRPTAPRPRVRQLAARPARGGGTAGGLAVATSAMVCPTCRSEYDGQLYCLRDARRLVPAEEMLGGTRSAGLFCATCRRAFEPGLRRCPHDGNELMPAALYWASRPAARRPAEPTGVIGRICPVCRGRYDLAARFCGVDGAELVVIN